MENLQHIVQRVEELYRQFDAEAASFQQAVGLDCPKGCNLCCYKKDIQVSVLELLPFALYLYQTNQHEQIYQELETAGDLCLCISVSEADKQLSGCRFYPYRSLICRLFGFSGTTDKHNKKGIFTCPTIKTGQAEKYGNAIEQINSGLEIPMASKYKVLLDEIDPPMADDVNHINTSLMKALNKVAYYFEEDREN